MPRSHAGPHRREHLASPRPPALTEGRPPGGRGNQAALQDRGLSYGGATGVEEPWVRELLEVAPVQEGDAGGTWGGVQERARQAGQGDPLTSDGGSQQPSGAGSGLSARLAALETLLAAGDVS